MTTDTTTNEVIELRKAALTYADIPSCEDAENDEAFERWSRAGKRLEAAARAYAGCEAHVPCQACAWSEPRPPKVDEEPPIVRGALDAQAEAERRIFDAQGDIAQIKMVVAQLRDAAGVPADWTHAQAVDFLRERTLEARS